MREQLNSLQKSKLSREDLKAFEETRGQFVTFFFRLAPGDRDGYSRTLLDALQNMYYDDEKGRIVASFWSNDVSSPNELSPDEVNRLTTFVGKLVTVDQKLPVSDIIDDRLPAV